MEIFSMIRGHFALLKNKPMTTPKYRKEFRIESVSAKKGDWQMVLNLSTGNQSKVFFQIYSVSILLLFPLIVN